MTTTKKNDFMLDACELALQSVQEKNGGPFGAVIVNKEGITIGSGHNRVTLDNDPTAHAEIVAIRDACQNNKNFILDGCTIYSSCEPCPMCLSAIYWARIEKIYYANTRQDAKDIGFDDAFIYEEIPKKDEERSISIKREECDIRLNAFQEWQEKNEKTCY